MDQLASIVLAAWLAGITAFLGGALAMFEGSAETEGKREAIHGIVAFGGGILYLVFHDLQGERMGMSWN